MHIYCNDFHVWGVRNWIAYHFLIQFKLEKDYILFNHIMLIALLHSSPYSIWDDYTPADVY